MKLVPIRIHVPYAIFVKLINLFNFILKIEFFKEFF